MEVNGMLSLFSSSLISASQHPSLDKRGQFIEVKSYEEITIVNHASTFLLPLLCPTYHPQQTSTVGGTNPERHKQRI